MTVDIYETFSWFIEIHARIGSASFYYAVFIALWALWRIYRKEGIDNNYWLALVIAEVILLIQGALGVFLYFYGGVKLAREIHVLYGGLSALVLPIAYLISRGKKERRELIIYTATLLLLILLTIRSLQTAGPLLIFE